MWRLTAAAFGLVLPCLVTSAPVECNGEADPQCLANDDDSLTSLIQLASPSPPPPPPPPRADPSELVKSKSASMSSRQPIRVPVAQSVHDYGALDVSDKFMDLSNVVQNNLGGAGPGSGAEEIVYKDVFVLPEASVDLVVTALTPYRPRNSDNNGVSGAVGSINMAGGKTTTFLFKFVNGSDHSQPVTLNRLYMSFYDIDGDNAGLREVISTPYFEHVFLHENTQIEIINRTGGQPPVFASIGVDSTGAANPDDPADLTPEQKARTLTFAYLLASEIEITFATWNGRSRSGRNFFFNGIAMFPDCINDTETASLTFTETEYSNFGGQGPDIGSPEGMRFLRVFEFDDGQSVDLVVKNIDGEGFSYVASNRPELNGVRDGFGCINMEVRAKAKFTFEFIDSATDAPVTMRNLHFTWMDFDGHPRMPDFKEVIITGGFEDIIVTNDTEMEIYPQSDGTTMFTSTQFDATGGSSNPANPSELTPEQERRSVTLTYPEVQSFTAIIDLSSGTRKMPRSIYFLGASRMSNVEEPEFCQ